MCKKGQRVKDVLFPWLSMGWMDRGREQQWKSVTQQRLFESMEPNTQFGVTHPSKKNKRAKYRDELHSMSRRRQESGPNDVRGILSFSPNIRDAADKHTQSGDTHSGRYYLSPFSSFSHLRSSFRLCLCLPEFSLSSSTQSLPGTFFQTLSTVTSPLIFLFIHPVLHPWHIFFFFHFPRQHLAFSFLIFISRLDDGHKGCRDTGRQRALSIYQMAEVPNLPVSHTGHQNTKPSLAWFEEGGGGWGREVYLFFFSKPTLNVTPINQISYLRHSGDDCTLKTATKAVSITATRKEKTPVAFSLQGDQKLEVRLDGMSKSASPLPPIL